VSERDPAGARSSAALALACAALALAAYGVLGGRADAPLPAGASAAASACVDREARGEVEKLHRENAALREQLLGSLEARVARLETSAPSAPSAPSPRRDGGAPPSSTPDLLPRYVRIVSPSAALTVRQDEGGGLSVKNSDPSLTGKSVSVDVTLEDGSASKVRVVVPPP
jgi:hypothetical protein